MTDNEIRRLQAEHWARPASEYHQAGRFHAPRPESERQSALIVDRAFLVRVLSKTPYMGPVKRKTRTGKRGPVPLGNQYSDGLDRRSNPYRLIAKLPKAARKPKHKDYEELAAKVLGNPDISKRKRLAELRYLVSRRADLPLVSESTLQRLLRSAAHHGPKTSQDV